MSTQALIGLDILRDKAVNVDICNDKVQWKEYKQLTTPTMNDVCNNNNDCAVPVFDGDIDDSSSNSSALRSIPTVLQQDMNILQQECIHELIGNQCIDRVVVQDDPIEHAIDSK